MKNLPGKLSILLLLAAITSSDAFSLTDTTKKILLASNRSTAKRTVVLKEANVMYPALLEGHKERSLDYVEKFAASRRGYLQRTYTRSKKYFPKVTAILKKYDVPSEFAVLLALESGFNGNAVSSAGAVGYWQIMDDVAREYGLKIASRNVNHTKSSKRTAKNTPSKKQKQVDDRKNFIKSTYAAAKYLRDRSRNLNDDWLLIAASYNYGVGNVWNAMQRTGKARPTFWDIKHSLPAETRAYVMNFIALNVIFRNYQKFATNELCFRTITRQTDQGIDADKISRQFMLD